MTKKQIIGIVVIAAIVLIGGASFALLRAKQPAASTTPAAAPQPSSSQSASTPASGDNQQSSTTPSKDPVKPNQDQTAPTAAPSLSVSIARVSQQTNGTVSVRTNVNGTTKGTCTFTFNGPSGQTFSRTSSVAFQETYYSCGNLDVERSAFASAGQWTVAVSVQSGQNQSPTVKNNFDVK